MWSVCTYDYEEDYVSPWGTEENSERFDQIEAQNVNETLILKVKILRRILPVYGEDMQKIVHISVIIYPIYRIIQSPVAPFIFSSWFETFSSSFCIQTLVFHFFPLIEATTALTRSDGLRIVLRWTSVFDRNILSMRRVEACTESHWFSALLIIVRFHL
jgi:hypothetical protein